MAPRGIYDRTKVAAVTAENLPTIPQNGEAKKIQNQIDAAVSYIRTNHAHVAATLIEIGHRFFEVKQILDAVTPDLRRAMKIPRFSTWLNSEAPEACGMSRRTAWNYYQAYSEAQATGLQEKTIIALAPTVLKTEKARAAVVTALAKKPEIVQHLNEVARNPRELKKLAESDEMKTIIKSLEPRQPQPVADRITKTIVSAYQADLKKDNSPEHVNEVLEELSAAISGALSELGLTQNVSVSIKAEAAQVVTAPTQAAVKELALPKTDKEAVEHLFQLVKSGAAKVVAAAHA